MTIIEEAMIKEAIKRLKEQQINCIKLKEAYDVAIRSLEAWGEVKEEIKAAQERVFCTEEEKQGLDVAKIIIDKHMEGLL